LDILYGKILISKEILLNNKAKFPRGYPPSDIIRTKSAETTTANVSQSNKNLGGHARRKLLGIFFAIRQIDRRVNPHD